MFKELKRYQVQLIPFQAVKNWALNNTQNEDLLLFESSASDDGEPIDLEYIEYGMPGDIPTTESFSHCEIALEQQDADRANYREGKQVSGPFYTDVDPVNIDGTYQRTVYSQVKTSFYNDYRDPTKIFGIENIDFENGRTKRRLAEKLRMFDIPRNVFGDKIIPNTVTIYDTSLDNDYTIEDDGYGNLTARRNLFSKQQEIGDFTNDFIAGVNTVCYSYFAGTIAGTIAVPLNLTVVSGSAILTWNDNSDNEDGFVIERSTDGVNYAQYITTSANITRSIDGAVSENNTYWYRVFAYNSITQSGYSNTASINFTSSFPCVGDAGVENLRWRTLYPNGGVPPAVMSANITGSSGSYSLVSNTMTSVAIDSTSSLCNPTTESYDLTITLNYVVTMASIVGSTVQAYLSIGAPANNEYILYTYPAYTGTFSDTLSITRTIPSASTGTKLRMYLPAVGSDIVGGITMSINPASVPIAPTNLTLTSSI